MTRLALLRLPLLVTVLLLAAVTGRPASASAVSCSGSACTGQDPYTTGCAEGRTVAGSAPILDGAGNRIGELILYWSARCQANWGQASFTDGNPPSTPPVTISVVGSVMASYDAPPVNFTTTASGSPVWGNMVYAPGCSYSTVSRGADKGEAVQVGCLAPGGGPNPNPPTPNPTPTGGPCQGTLCNGLDPYASHCSNDASVAGSSPLVDSRGTTLGTVKLYFSPACQSGWGQVDFNDGNPPTTPPVTVTVIGTDGASPGNYDSHPVEYVTTGSGSPVWGNMVYSPGCAVAYVSRGDASGKAVQSGCPAPGEAPQPAADTLNATGLEISLYGGLEINAVIANFSASNPAAQPGDFTVTIEWGDGTESAGAVSGSAANFEVHGDHIYPNLGGAEAQGYQATVTIRDRSGGTATAYTPIELVSTLPGAPPSSGVPTIGQGPSDGQPGVSAGDKAGSIASSGFSTFVSGAGCAVGSEIPFLDVLVCADAGKNAVELGSAIADPPDHRYRHVFHAIAPRIGHIPRQCPHLARAACTALYAAIVRYARASAETDVFAEALGVTANRFGGAKRAHNRSAERLQRTAARRYFARWAAAQAGRRVAGRAVALLLLRDHLDRRVTAAEAARGRSRLLTLHGVSRQDLARLHRNGLIGSRTKLLALLQRDLKWAPSPGDTTLSAAVGG
jgi:Protein of unknown function (DUF2690)